MADDLIIPEDLPKLALSIRQPWTHCIMHLGKPVENRTWWTSHRGPICIHAAKGMTKAEWADAADFVFAAFGLTLPMPAGLQFGGIVGVADLVEVVTGHPSPWFFGRYGFVLRNPQPVPFIPVKGALGFFEWRKNL